MSGAGFLELWRELPDSLGIISHIGTEPIQLTWTEAATVISCLQERLHDCGVVNGTTVLLQAACGQSELYSLLLLNALALNGCRVVFPMTPLEKHQQQWCDVLHYEVEISPLRMDIYEPATSIAPSKVRTVGPAALVKNDLVAFIKDSLAGKLKNAPTPRHAGFDSKETLFISTSGSSGEPKFISYDWDAFVASAKSWEAFGLFASIVWDDELVSMTANDAVAAERDSERGGQDSAPRTNEAVDWLRHCLTNGPCPAKEIKKKASEDSIASRTLDRAATELGVTKKPGGVGMPWVWRLPNDDREYLASSLAKESQSRQERHYGETDEDGETETGREDIVV